MFEIRGGGLCWQSWCSGGGCRKWLRYEECFGRVDAVRLQEMVEIREVCWQRWMGAVLVTAGTG
jgi:hypothetical protein